MILPVRCYTCGKVLANLTERWETYAKQHGNDNWLPFFEKHRIHRYCCKRVLMSQVPDPNQTHQYTLPPSITISDDKISNMFVAR